MPKGQPIEWTRELLERVEGASGQAVLDLADEIGCSTNNIYSVKSRIPNEGIDGILAKSADRYHNYGTRRRAETVEEQLGNLYTISLSGAGRGGSASQFTVTLPSRVAEAWVARWGRQIRFQPTDEGLLIVPVEPLPAPEIPVWLENGSPQDGS